MLTNRSIPDCIVIPELEYPDIKSAADWLEKAFGFSVRLQIAEHRAQMNVPGGGAIVLVNGAAQEANAKDGHCVMIRIEDANAHHKRAKNAGANIIRAPEDHPFGERQYTAQDPAGHIWTFSQSIANIDPETWGAKIGKL